VEWNLRSCGFSFVDPYHLPRSLGFAIRV